VFVMAELIGFEDFLKVDMCVGTIVSAQVNEKARKSAYVMQVDFGADIGIKTTSAQITKEHSLDDLLNTQVVAVMNFPTKNIAGVVSECLVLAVVEEYGRTVLLKPAKAVLNGSSVL